MISAPQLSEDLMSESSRYLYLIEEKLSAPRISDADISLDPQVPFVIRRGFGKGTTDYVLFSHESCS